jgi:hypothetical protein
MSTPGDELPAYTAPAPAAVAHVYSLDTKGTPWLSLRIANSRAHAPAALPLFADGDEIQGAVELALDKPESAKAISIRVRRALSRLVAHEFTARHTADGELDDRRAGRVRLPRLGTDPLDAQIGREVEGQDGVAVRTRPPAHGAGRARREGAPCAIRRTANIHGASKPRVS